MTLAFDDRDLESLLRDLVSGDPEVRRLAVERVGLLPLERALPRLVGCLGDADWRVRKAAVERLVACPETGQVCDALLVALGDGENPGRRNAAVEALVEFGPRAVPPLIEGLGSVADPDVRKLVVDILAGIGDRRAGDALLGRLDDPDPNVRAATADGLGTLGGEAARQALLGTAVRSDEERFVRFAALHALGVMDAPVRACELTSVLDDALLQPAGLVLLGRVDDEEGAAVLLKGLASSSRGSREAAMRSLLRLLAQVDDLRAADLAAHVREVAIAAPALVASAVERLDDSDLSTRLVLIQFLGLVRAEEAVAPILLAGRDEALSEVALATLAAMGDVAERVIDAVWVRLDAEARRDACVLFGGSEGELSVARLLSALEETDPEIRIAAARSIGRRQIAEGLAPLARRLEIAGAEEEFEADEEIAALTEALIALTTPDADPASTLRAQAVALLGACLEGAPEKARVAMARVLGCIARRQDAPLITLLLKDPVALVRRAAVDALARLEPEGAKEALRLALADESPRVRIAAAHALAGSPSAEVFEDLRRLANDDDGRVRAAAVRAVALRFARSDDPEQRRATLALVDGAFADEAPVALAAVEALGELGGPDAARAIAMLLRPEPELVQCAVRCVGAHADAAQLNPLLPLVSHPDWSVRAEAIHALAERGVAKAVPPILRLLETEQDEFVREVILRALNRLEG